MSNTPTLPDADVAEPIPDEEYDDDVVGVPEDDDDSPMRLPEPDVITPEPSRPL